MIPPSGWSLARGAALLAGGTLLAGVALAAAPALTGELVQDGALGKRVSAAPADLVVYYAGEQKGSMDECGCTSRPRGGFARLVSYVGASRAASPAASLLLNPGQWLDDPGGFDGLLRPEAVASDRWMARGAAAVAWDALNVAPPDVAGFSVLPADALRGLPLVSASITGPGIARWRVIERGGVKVGITGIAAADPTLAQAQGYRVGRPEDAVETVRALAAEADVVVLLAWHAPEAAKAIAKAVPEVDVVIDANRHTAQEEPFLVGDAVWVFSMHEGQRVGELRLGLDGGRVTSAFDRQIDMDPQVPDDRALADLQRQARAAIEATWGP